MVATGTLEGGISANSCGPRAVSPSVTASVYKRSIRADNYVIVLKLPNQSIKEAIKTKLNVDNALENYASKNLTMDSQIGSESASNQEIKEKNLIVLGHCSGLILEDVNADIVRDNNFEHEGVCRIGESNSLMKLNSTELQPGFRKLFGSTKTSVNSSVSEDVWVCQLTNQRPWNVEMLPMQQPQEGCIFETSSSVNVNINGNSSKIYDAILNKMENIDKNNENSGIICELQLEKALKETSDLELDEIRMHVAKNLDVKDTKIRNANILKQFFITIFGANSSKKKRGLALLNATSLGLIQGVKKLISEGADVNAAVGLDGTTCLHAAAYNGFEEIVEFLLESNADVNATDDKYQITPLHLALQQSNFVAAKKLIFAGANVNSADDEGITPLYLASRKGNLELVEILISRGAKVNRVAGPNGACPLHAASKNGHLNVVNYLIVENAIVNKADKKNGVVPLHLASQNGHEAVVEALVAAGADLDKQDKVQGLTPLHVASSQGYSSIVRTLLSAGASIECRENFKRFTPLHFAALNGHEEVVRTLISAGANMNVESMDPVRKPADVARMKGYEKIATLLESEEIIKCDEIRVSKCKKNE